MDRISYIKAIHTAKRKLCLDDATYKDLLFEATGKDSCGDMDEKELERALTACRKAGFKPKARPETALMVRMVRALWLQMHEEGIVKNSSNHALDSWCLRMVRVVPEHCTVKQLQVVIEALKKWWDRAASLPSRQRLEDILAGRSSGPAMEGGNG